MGVSGCNVWRVLEVLRADLRCLPPIKPLDTRTPEEIAAAEEQWMKDFILQDPLFYGKKTKAMIDEPEVRGPGPAMEPPTTEIKPEASPMTSVGLMDEDGSDGEEGGGAAPLIIPIPGGPRKGPPSPQTPPKKPADGGKPKPGGRTTKRKPWGTK